MDIVDAGLQFRRHNFRRTSQQDILLESTKHQAVLAFLSNHADRLSDQLLLPQIIPHGGNGQFRIAADENTAPAFRVTNPGPHGLFWTTVGR